MSVAGRGDENPLVPDAVLERMYEIMRRVHRLSRGSTARSTSQPLFVGEEACRASSLLSLRAGDLVSDLPHALLLEEALRLAPLPAPNQTRLPSEGWPSWLRSSAYGLDRVLLALGAAGALHVQANASLLLLYLAADELTTAGWKHVLHLAGEAQLPVIFVVLPSTRARSQGALSDRAQGWGVPGMPVDAADAVALYRVLQESVLRARSADGPALVECVRWRVPGSVETDDALAAMRRVLRARRRLGRLKP